MIFNFSDYLHESTGISRYSDEDLGLIKAWGHVLYLGYHNLPEDSNQVERGLYTRIMREYNRTSDEDEEFRDWMSDGPPTYGGVPLFNKKRIREHFGEIAKKTPAPSDFIVYRTSKEEQDGLNSYTTDPDQYSHYGSKTRSYRIPKGYPVVFADGIADNNEVILDLSPEDLKKFRIDI